MLSIQRTVKRIVEVNSATPMNLYLLILSSNQEAKLNDRRLTEMSESLVGFSEIDAVLVTGKGIKIDGLFTSVEGLDEGIKTIQFYPPTFISGKSEDINEAIKYVAECSTDHLHNLEIFDHLLSAIESVDISSSEDTIFAPEEFFNLLEAV